MPDSQQKTAPNQSQSQPAPKPPISTTTSTSTSTTPSKASTSTSTSGAHTTKPAASVVPTTPTATATANATANATVTTRRRRSARVLEHDPILAPGFGTRKDIVKLARELSAKSNGNGNGNNTSTSTSTSTTLSVAAVEALMKSRGTGVRRSQEPEASAAAAAAAAAAPASTAWADFMAEEGTTATSTSTTGAAAAATASGSGAAASAPTPTSASTTTSAAAAKDDDEDDGKKRKSVSTSVPGARRFYELPIDGSIAGSEHKAKKAKGTAGEEQGGVLLQAGTLDSSSVGRTKSKLIEPYHLTVPTKILPNVRITKVFASCNAVHSIALDSTGQAWCWGRNEAGQLGATFPAEVILPKPVLDLPGGKMVTAAIGKSHTLFLMEDGSVYAVGANKAGQCGVKSSIDLIPNYRKCVLPEDVTIVKIACGEDFSAALDSEGRLYTTGSSEFGQLGNGETGEHFITASKIGFTNCAVFTRRDTFCHAPNEVLHSNSGSSKVVPLAEDVRIQDIACGKHHCVALEAYSDHQSPRVFTWGCGNYGVLGHGVQSDEFFPRCVGALQALPPGDGEMALSAGSNCSLLQTANGHVYYWGKHRSVGEATMRPTVVDALANNQHVVSHCAAGGATVVCTTANAVTVSYGQGPHGELGLGAPKSSAKPTFIATLDGCRVADLACGYGHTLFIVRNEDAEDIAAVKKLPELDMDSVEELVKAAEEKAEKKLG